MKHTKTDSACCEQFLRNLPASHLDHKDAECPTCGRSWKRWIMDGIPAEEHLDALLSVIDEAYHGGELRIAEDLPRGERGDGLADFLATEVREVCQDEPWDRIHEVTLDALFRVRREIDDVIAAVVKDNE